MEYWKNPMLPVFHHSNIPLELGVPVQEEVMDLKELSVADFVTQMGAASPAPGGGSAAALVGALGAALCAMVTRLTIGRERYRAVEQKMAALQGETEAVGSELLELMEEDTQAYQAVVLALRQPKQTEAEQEARAIALERATRKAAEVPLRTLRAALRVAELAAAAVAHGNPNCVTDAGSAAQLARAAGRSAAYNVRINLGTLKDREFIRECTQEVERLLRVLDAKVRAVEQQVDGRLG